MELEKAIETIKNSYVMSTKHCLDDENIKFKKAIETLLEELIRVQNKYDKVVLRNIEYDKTLEKLQKETVYKKKIEDKLEEIKENISYLSKFNDWKEKDYTNKDIIENIIQTLQELLEGK